MSKEKQEDDFPLQCSLDEQQCQQECENKNDRGLCPFTSRLPYKKEFDAYFKKYYPHLIPKTLPMNPSNPKPVEQQPEESVVAKYIAVSPNNTALIPGWYKDAEGNNFQLIQHEVAASPPMPLEVVEAAKEAERRYPVEHGDINTAIKEREAFIAGTQWSFGGEDKEVLRDQGKYWNRVVSTIAAAEICKNTKPGDNEELNNWKIEVISRLLKEFTIKPTEI